MDNDLNQKRERLINALKEKTKTKSYHINYEGITNGDLFISKIGGLGYWDTNKEYPKDNNGNQLVLLAQINFEKENFNNPLLPNKGILQFYISTDDLYGMEIDSPDDQNGFKAVYHETVNYNLTKEELSNIKTSSTLNYEDEEYFPFEGEYKMTFVETEDYLGPSCYNFKEVLNEVVNQEFGIDVTDTPLYKVFGEGIMDVIYENLRTDGSKLLGYPCFAQRDPRGINDVYKILLFQMDSEGPVMWGDSGVANFFIKDYNNYNDVFYTWDCM